MGNDPSKGHQYLLQKYGDAEEEFQDTLDQDHDRWHSNKIVWNTVALSAPDQLRHRVSWALSSIFVPNILNLKLRIENLIERGFISRDKNDYNKYIYEM